MSDQPRLGYDLIELPATSIIVTKSRSTGADANGQPIPQALPGAFRPGLRQQDQLVHDLESRLLTELQVHKADIYTSILVGGADAAFIDSLDPGVLAKTANGYHNVGTADAIFGYADSVKLARLGDCGLLVVEGITKDGQDFNGFIHTTRLNLRTDDQFKDEQGIPRGGVELMLRKMIAHYQPSQLKLTLAAAIIKEFYIHAFQPTPEMLAENPNQTEESVREEYFPGWLANGWIEPHLNDDRWQSPMSEVDIYAAIRHQVVQAGLADVYDDTHGVLNGDPTSGHASHRAHRLGLVEATRDAYLLIPKGYPKG